MARPSSTPPRRFSFPHQERRKQLGGADADGDSHLQVISLRENGPDQGLQAWSKSLDGVTRVKYTIELCRTQG